MTTTPLGNGAASYIEPSLGVTFLPRCPHCGGKHPLAYMPALPDGVCPDCGTLLAEAPAEIVVPAELTGRDVWTSIARACLKAGKHFALLWRSRQ